MSGKLSTTYCGGQYVGCESSRPKFGRLVGHSNEVNIGLEGHSCTALLDTGSMVSTVSDSFANTLGLQVQPLEELLRVEGFAGHSMQFSGFVEAKLELPEFGKSMAALFLVVPETSYHRRVPVLLGTNLLGELLDLDHQSLSPSWCSVIKSLACHRKLESSGDLGEIRSTKKIVVPPQSRVQISGLTRAAKTACMRMTVVVEEAKSCSLPGGLVVAPSLQILQPGVSSQRAFVEVANLSDKAVTIPPKFRLGVISRATVVQRPGLSVVDDESPTPDNDVLGLAAMAIFDESDDDSDGDRPKSGSHSESFPAASDSFVDQFLGSMSSDLSSAQVSQVKDLLTRWKCVFSQHSMDLGRTDLVKHHIKLKDPEPFQERYRRVPPSMVDQVRQHLQEMLDLGVIKRSCSPFASNVVLAKKKDNSLRFCIDLRTLNSRTVRDSYTLPRIDEALDSLRGATWFSTLDLKSGYWQVEMAEEDKEKTAFSVGPLGFYECHRMPFGLTNAPATFQRLMETCMGDLYLSQCLVYIDDVIVFSRTFEEHLQRLEGVFQRLHDAGLKLKPSKCSFFQQSIKFLGHQVSAEGVSPDPDKVAAVKAWPIPSNVSEVQSFLGFLGFYRRFIQGFSKIAKPLHDLVQAAGAAGLKKRRVKRLPFKWEDCHQKAFERLVDLCTTAPVLAFADYSKPFILHVDASSEGLGAVIYQEIDGKKRPIAYASRRLSNAERNYPVHKLEFLALRWAVTDKFHDYLFGNKFTVYTDNNPLTYVLTSAKLDATGHRWVSQLANYDFDILYKSGRKNLDADALSRIDWSRANQVSPDVVSAVLGATDLDSGAVEALCLSAEAQVLPGMVDDLCEGKPARDWSEIQRSDPVVGSVIKILESGSECDKVGPAVRTYLRERSRLVLRNKVLYRVRQGDQDEFYQLVLPSKYRGEILSSCHDDLGHLGRDRTLSVLRDRVFWPGMARDVADYIAQCKRCLCRKASIQQRAPLVNIESTQPLELLCVDFLKLEPCKGNVENILVITDHFSRFAQAVPTKNQSAKTTAKVIFDHFVVHYGVPVRLHSDQGRNFTSSVIRHLCELLSVSKSQTTPYHPMGNGQCERFNSTLLSMLGTLDNSQKSDWKSYVPSLVHAYNCTRSEVTGFSPYYIMFGRHPRLPVDLLLGRVDDQKSESYGEFVKSLKKRLEHAYLVASEKAQEAQQTYKERYDQKSRGSTVEVGDCVLVRNVGLKGTHKLADKWQDDVYKVLRQPNPDIPVFVVRRDDGVGKEKTLHRNLLLPLPFSLTPPPLNLPETPSVPKRKKTPRSKTVSKESDTENSGSSSSEEGEEVVFTHLPVPAPRPHRPIPAPRPRRSVLVTQPVEDVPVVPVVDVPVEGAEVGSDVSEVSELGQDIAPHVLDADMADGDSVHSDSEEAVGSESPPLRRSTRARRPPIRFDPQVYDFAQRAYSADKLSRQNKKLSSEVSSLKTALRTLLK